MCKDSTLVNIVEPVKNAKSIIHKKVKTVLLGSQCDSHEDLRQRLEWIRK